MTVLVPQRKAADIDYGQQQVPRRNMNFAFSDFCMFRTDFCNSKATSLAVGLCDSGYIHFFCNVHVHWGGKRAREHLQSSDL